ncbi:ABC transporter substrate-binding protein [Candidatus Halocynthiibacter alkanivorans]|jgi:NitT/TauT family transport system substrate-binding protein|uniref:ABC transporter substrate-binding protein n=1 Tax=Candidatus Halocynthiibacter alkanivorans TaxID=2267619 RepID=UPI000DF37CB9|nr:ABC transporter substrate-binding protein [Candidatus Halocynthiibacter alkanivorans]
MLGLTKLKTAAAVAGVLILAAMPVAAQENGTMRVAFGDIPGGEMVNFMIAVARAEERGVKVEVSYLQSEDLAAQAIVSGQADIGVGTPYALIQKVNAPIRMFYQLSMLRFYPVVNGEKYQTWNDLQGADVAVHGRGSGTEAIMKLMAKENGVTYNSVSYVPGSGVRAGALLQGRIDVSIVDYERSRLLEREAPGKFVFLPLPEITATDEALYANRDWLETEQKAVSILVEELIKTWREINMDPSAVATLRAKYNVLPDIEQIEVDELVPAFTQGVSIDLYPSNGGNASSVVEDFTFFTSSGSLDGVAEDLEVEDYWYLAPVEAAVKKLGTM